MLSVLAELLRELIVANTRDGLAAARARGRNGGRRSKLNPAQAAHAQQIYDAGEQTVAQIAALLGVARTTVTGISTDRVLRSPPPIGPPRDYAPTTASTIPTAAAPDGSIVHSRARAVVSPDTHIIALVSS